MARYATAAKRSTKTEYTQTQNLTGLFARKTVLSRIWMNVGWPAEHICVGCYCMCPPHLPRIAAALLVSVARLSRPISRHSDPYSVASRTHIIPNSYINLNFSPCPLQKCTESFNQKELICMNQSI